MAQPVLTFSDAIHQGVEQNFHVRIAKNENAIAQRNVFPGNAGYLPAVTAHASVDQAMVDANVKVFTGNELEQSGAESTTAAAGIRAEWILFDGMGRTAVYGKLKEQLKISNLETRSAIEEVVASITMAYCNIIREKQLMEACRERLSVSNFRYRLATERLNAGLASEMEWLQSQVLNHADSTSLTMQEAAFRKAKIVLNQLLATDVMQDFTAEDSISLSPMPSLESLIANGHENNSRYQQAARQVTLGLLELKEIGSRRFPRVSVSGSYNYFRNETEASFIQYNRNYGPQIGINAGISLYDGSRLRRTMETARIRNTNQELALLEMEQELTSLIIQTWLDYQSYLKSISLSREGYDLAEKNLAIAKQAWETGVVSSLHFREAQEELFQAASTLVNAIYEAKIAETDLFRLSGTLVQ